MQSSYPQKKVAAAAKKPAAKAPVAKKVTTAAKKSSAKAPETKPLAKAAKPVAKAPAKLVKATPAVKTPTSCTDSEAEDTDDSEDEESDDSADGDLSPPEPETRSQCDHVLEFQVLKRTLESTGGFSMIASPNSGLTTDDIPTLMAPLKTAINGKTNLFFLDKKLNQVKRDEVTAALKGQSAKTSVGADLKSQQVAVNEYLTDTSVNGPSITPAKKLDTLVKEMLTQAEAQGVANIKSCAGATAVGDEKALKAAKDP
ncbi:hypothetical protein B0H10DRAFT_2236261 [Mycena sp. CBHHK59/15]|nr:hypothetical protein B0H10DRAFT_2236261 [Mycena sp. CBHHK59/15]